MAEIVKLRAGNLAVDLAPEAGGSIARFDEETPDGPVHWMRPGTREAIENRQPRKLAQYPLVPYSNRIRDGRFPVGDRIVTVPINAPPEPHAIHGDGWLHPWTVVSADERRAEIAFDWSRPGLPMRYTARQSFALEPGALRMAIEVTNRGDGPMPAGVGFHPWFRLTPGARMTASTGHVWRTDAENLPTERIPVPPEMDFAAGRRFAGCGIHNCYGGWDGRAVLEWPERSMRMTLDAEGTLGFLLIYAPDGADFFCVEPVSNATDAFNLGPAGVDDVGYRLLAPGETLAARLTVSVERG